VADRLPDLVEPLRRSFEGYRAHLADPRCAPPPLAEILLAEPA
jgi:hypothetical protein